jgi:hypothetical protein
MMIKNFLSLILPPLLSILAASSAHAGCSHHAPSTQVAS